jgi:predicted ATPase
VLRLGLELASCEQGVLLIEEPEVHLHRKSVGAVARALVAAVQRGLQLFVSTQSLELLDALLAGSSEEVLERLTLFHLDRDADGTLSSTCLPGGDVALLRTALGEDVR